MLDWIKSAIEIIGSVFSLLNKIWDKIFPPPSSTEKEQQNQKETNKEGDDLKKGGRPQW
jgi:hypothetical protein